MDIIADILLAAGAFGAGFYCLVLGRRLNRFNNLEKGVGGAVAVLSIQVDDLKKTLDAAQTAAGVSASTLTELVERAETITRRLELQMASLHDIPEAPKSTDTTTVKQSPKQQETARESEPMFMRRRTQGDAA